MNEDAREASIHEETEQEQEKVQGRQEEEQQQQLALRPHEDARAIVRLFQCQQCSYPLREPMILPCGNTICKPCMPASHIREHISYPQNAARAEGFICPLPDCGVEHSLADCGTDVTLSKMMEVVKDQIGLQTARSRVLDGGRIVAAFSLASMGELHYHSDLTFTPMASDQEETVKVLDTAVMTGLQDIVRTELECTVCYGLMVDPLTTACGHTFCRKCVARVLDHSRLCPACRRRLTVRPGVLSELTNKRLTALTEALLTDELAARLIAVEQEEALDDTMTPLFPCTLAFPQMPTFLHIFEPRYRLMVRRAMENGSRRFGMMMYNERREPQAELGNCVFMQYGTMLNIESVQILPDGRSLLITQGMYRFKILSHSLLDGYMVGRVQRIDDIPLADEEAQEALETSGPEPAEDDFEGHLMHMSTQDLLQTCLDFIAQARARSASWLHQRMITAYGQPPTDPAMFPFWFASILPIRENQKYAMLPLTSVRERLKLTARWIHALEEARCAHLAAMRRFARARPVEPQLSASEIASSDAATPDTEQAEPNAMPAPATAAAAASQTTVQAQDAPSDPEATPESPTEPSADVSRPQAQS